MPEIITCPDCGRKLRVPDALAGKKVKCPDCNVKFTGGITTAPGGAAAKPARPKRTDDEDDDRPARKKSVRRRDDDDEDHPRPARSEYDDDTDERSRPSSTRSDRRRGWKMTLLGLNLIIYGIYVLLGTMALALFGCLTLFLIGIGGISSMDPDVMAGSVMGAGIAAMLLYGALGLGYLAASVLQITGHGFCMMVPHKDGTARKGLAIATFACAIASILFYFAGCGLGFMVRGAHVVSYVSFATALGYFVCYFLFLRGVATAMREDRLAMQVVYYMIAVPSVMVLGFVMFCVLMMTMGALAVGAANSQSSQSAMGSLGAMGALGMICNLLFFCLWVGLFVWYIVIVHQVRNAVRNYLE